jgi:hypothetical protein
MHAYWKRCLNFCHVLLQDWFFAMTIASTIGYGNYAPETVEGQWFLIFYALLAIPVAGLCITIISSRLLVRYGGR